MAITFVLHEATRTGAPRLGGLIARELQRDDDVRLIVMKDGPLTPWLRDLLGARNVVVCRDDPFHFRATFEERLRLAVEMLEASPSDLVYANSLAASVFTLAAAVMKRKAVLHVHEKSTEMLNLLAHDMTKLEVMRVVDALVLAADDIRADLADVFRAAPAEIEIFGVAVDVEAIREAAEQPCPSPLNIHGETLTRGERAIIGMSGHASARKGADVFFETAAALPDRDFLWIGNWRREETVDNIAYEAFARAGLPNFYLAGAVDNPYPYMQMLDLFFLSSREDPHPLVLGEALALGLPILCFSETTAVADRLGRSAIVCYGPPNAADAVRVLRASPVEALRNPALRAAGAAYVADYDLRAKMPRISGLLARLRGDAAPAELKTESLDMSGLETESLDMEGAVRRELPRGGTELSFS